MTMSPETEAGLDPSRWLDEHGDYLFRFAAFRLRDAAAAEDVVQETLLAALQSKYGGHSSERTWLVGIVKHKIIDFYRKVYHSREVGCSDEKTQSENFDPFENSGEWIGHWRTEYAPSSA